MTEGEESETNAKVMSYLSDCGVDISKISIEDFDGKSLEFLQKMVSDENVIDDKLDETVHEIREMQERFRGGMEDRTASDKTDLEHHDSSENAELQDDTVKHLQRLVDIQKSLLSSPLTQGHDIIQEAMKEVRTTKKLEKPYTTDLDMDSLEPWQRALFEKLDNQSKSIEECHKRIDELSSLVLLNMRANQIASSISRNNDVKVTSATHSDESLRTRVPVENVRGEQAAAQQQAGLLVNIFATPTAFFHWLGTTRPIRVLRLIRREADHFRMPIQGLGLNPNQGFLDIHLMMKLAFICIFLRARIGSNERRTMARKAFEKQNRLKGTADDAENIVKGIFREALSDMVVLWKTYSAELLLTAAIIVYLIQTGLIFFLYQIIFKENVFAKVWRDEDLETNVTVPDRRPERNENAEVEQNNDRRDENAVNRRGRRDRRERAPRDADNGIHHNEVNQALHAGRPDENGHGLRGVLPNAVNNVNIANLGNTLIGGVIDRPFEFADENVQDDEGADDQNNNDARVRNVPQEEIFLGQMIDGIKDFLYIFSSFFLSIFPMWRPRAREVEHEEREPVVPIQNNEEHRDDDEIEPQAQQLDENNADEEINDEENDE